MKVRGTHKHARVFAALSRDIRAGRWRPGERIPGEIQLVHDFGVSRITISRAVRDLQIAGLVERHAGSGTYVTSARPSDSLSFGLLIPDLGETEIFEPISHAMMSSPLARQHALLIGNTSLGERSTKRGSSREEKAWQLCRQYVARNVAGVFFAPLEMTPGKDELNQRIARALDEARIPVVLLDRPSLPYPEHERHDLVGIDNRRAGRIMTDHLLRLGCRRLLFVASRYAAFTVDDRERGFREALHERGLPCRPAFLQRMDPENVERMRDLMASQRPDGIVCANDRTAARLMHALQRLGYRIPQQVRLVGIDDVEYAHLLPVPLTTLRQPTQQIGEVAMAAMLQRIERPDLPAREIHLPCELVVRESCGASNHRST